MPFLRKMCQNSFFLTCMAHLNPVISDTFQNEMNMSVVETEKESNNIRKYKVDKTDIVYPVIFIAVFLGFWQLTYSLGVFPKISFPAPYTVGESFVKIISNYSLPKSIGITLLRLGASFAISIA